MAARSGSDERRPPWPPRPWPRPPRPLTAAGLEQAALIYLERYNASAEMLRRVLMRRAERAVRGGVIEAEAATALALGVVEKLRSLGYLSDRRFAESRAAGLHRRGKGIAHIRQDLAARGVAAADIAVAIAALGAEAPDPDFIAAIRLARKKRLGPWRTDGPRADGKGADGPRADGKGARNQRAEDRGRDLAALARAGFDFDTARRVIDAETSAELEDALIASQTRPADPSA